MTDKRLAAALKAVEGHTPGPWSLWRGPQFVGGGEDICIGAGDTWLANMDHRVNYNPAEHGECGTLPGWRQVEEADIATIDPGDEITAEQLANANLIALAPALPAALRLAMALQTSIDGQANLADEFGINGCAVCMSEWKETVRAPAGGYLHFDAPPPGWKHADDCALSEFINLLPASKEEGQA